MNAFFKTRTLSLAVFSLACGWARAVEPADLTELSLEDLANVRVTTASRREQSLAQTPAAIDVITQDDIRRSGVTSIADALRLAPGMDVARVDSHEWAISARGFNDVFADKLLVMIDGRTVYTPLFSGTFWDVQDTLLEDIDRIEVIRGPGASLWGANAVNGVVNVITKSARETQGLLISAGGGTEERGFTGIRYGAQLGDDAYWRVYGKFMDRADSASGKGDANDAWWSDRGGFRIDWEPPNDRFTLQGDLYDGQENQTYTRLRPEAPYTPYQDPSVDRISGGNLLGRWTHRFEQDSEFTLQAYYDRTERDSVIIDERRDTFDLDLQDRFNLGDRNALLVGTGYRVSEDKIGNSFDVSLIPNRRTIQLFSAFLQDEITLVEKRLTATLGTKLEHNDFTGFEVQPSGRLLWTPEERQSVWAAVSRAVRTPSIAERDVILNEAPVYPPGALARPVPPLYPGSPAAVTSLLGSGDFASENLLAYELGYRVQPAERLTLDAALFYNVYSDLRGLALAANPVRLKAAPPSVALTAANPLKGETYGGELATTLQITKWWQLRGSYSLLETQIRARAGEGDPATASAYEGRSPHNQFQISSRMELPGRTEFDAWLRYVDGLQDPHIPSYYTLDLRIGWQVSRNVDISIIGQNLLSPRHSEFSPTFIATRPTEVERGVFGRITWRF